jgi:hypothetical protein
MTISFGGLILFLTSIKFFGLGIFYPIIFAAGRT